MHSPTILVTLLALGLTTALPHNNRRQATIPTAVDITCAQAVILAQAIALNVADQQQELATVNTMAALLQANPIDTAAWAQSRTALLQFVNNGIAIRQANQLITPAQNPSTAGVATVASAQLTELALATNLTMMGADNVPGNSAIVRTLQQNFAGGIQQNNRNMADAVAGCGSVAAVPVPAPTAPTAAAPGAPPPAPAAPAPAPQNSSNPEAPKPSSSAAAAGADMAGGAASKASVRHAEARGAARLGLV